MPRLSICIPTLDRSNGLADRLIGSVITNTFQTNYEIVLEDCKGQLRGYTEPMNTAVARARGEYVLAVNDDVVLSKGWLGPMLEALEDPAVWCVTPDATHTDGPQVLHPWMMLWRRWAWEQIGGLDERFILWGSDIDLARRLLDLGKPPVKVKLPIPVTHELNATCRHHPELGPICLADLQRFREKWGVDAEAEKHRLAAL